MIKFVLGDTLNELQISRNYLAVEGKIRPATLHELFHGSAKRLDIETLEKILCALNKIAKEKNTRKFDTNDIIKFIPDDDQ